MTSDTSLRALLAAYGLLASSSQPVGRPSLTRKQQAAVRRYKRKHASQLAGTSALRTDLLNASRGIPRRDVLADLSEAEANAELLVMLLNDEQVALLLEKEEVGL